MLLDDINGMDVISSDGNILGKVEGFITEEQWKIKSLSVKIDSEDVKKLGKKKPLLSSLKLDISKEQIDGIKDKVVLKKPMSDLGKHFKEHKKDKDIIRLMDSKILGRDGKLIGKVVNVKIDLNKWKIPSISIKIKKDALSLLNMDDGIFANKKIMLSTEHIGEIGEDFVMLKTTTEELKDVIHSLKAE